MIKGIGIDLVDVERLQGILGRHGDRFVKRVLTDDERRFCEAHRQPAPHVAARFAAKEAALKALGSGLAGGIRWRDVEVVRGESGAPSLRLAGVAADLARERGVRTIHVSLTHDTRSAAAVVVMEGDS